MVETKPQSSTWNAANSSPNTKLWHQELLCGTLQHGIDFPRKKKSIKLDGRKRNVSFMGSTHKIHLHGSLSRCLPALTMPCFQCAHSTRTLPALAVPGMLLRIISYAEDRTKMFIHVSHSPFHLPEVFSVQKQPPAVTVGLRRLWMPPLPHGFHLSMELSDIS